jgi:hypothetical protein
MKQDDIDRRIRAALMTFMRDDEYLLAHDLSERCIASRLALHLQAQFQECKVDVEYNRAGDTPKRLLLSEECVNSFDEDGRALVVPDIIVHQRGDAGPNILGIEVKKVSDSRGFACDRRRLVALKARLGYDYAVLLECETRGAKWHWRHIARVGVI